MIDPDNPKEYRRQQMQKNYEKKPSPSDETKFLAKNKKELQKKRQNIESDELWDEWNNS